MLEETQFHEAVVKSFAEPIPYFCQFWSAESAKLQDKKQHPGGTSVKTSFLEFSTKDDIIEEEEFVEEKVPPAGTAPDDERRLSVIIRKENSREQKEAIVR